jgi:hypothetical protein
VLYIFVTRGKPSDSDQMLYLGSFYISVEPSQSSAITNSSFIYSNRPNASELLCYEINYIS